MNIKDGLRHERSLLERAEMQVNKAQKNLTADPREKELLQLGKKDMSETGMNMLSHLRDGVFQGVNEEVKRLGTRRGSMTKILDDLNHIDSTSKTQIS